MSKKKMNSIEKPEISETALEMFRYMFYSRLWYIEKQKDQIVAFAQQAKIKRLQYLMKQFIYSRPYSKFRIITLPPNGMDIENADFALEVKNFDYFVEGLEPTRIVLVISITWDSFKPFIETVDKNLMEIKL